MAEVLTESRTPVVAVIGNPNAGKTTLFNSLTGSHQKVGNYPGVTVEHVVGTTTIEGRPIEVLDVPGLYSLVPVSEDERVAAAAIQGTLPGIQKPDLLVCVLDATNLERNLYLFRQLSEVELPVLLVLTMVDRLSDQGAALDTARMANLLGIDVVAIVGHKERGLEEVRHAILQNLEDPKLPVAPLDELDESIRLTGELRERFARSGVDVRTSDLRRALHGPGSWLEESVSDRPELANALAEARETLAQVPVAQESVEERYAWANRVHKLVLKKVSAPVRKRSVTDKLDLFLTHRVFGLATFIGVMYLVFQSIYTFAKPVMEWIGQGIDALAGAVRTPFESYPLLQSFLADGIVRGVGSMLVFLPQILILFLFISILEGSGYLARAAFLMDRLLGWCGLNGRAFIPLLASFACAIPGIMAARVMPDKKSRLATILVAPLMSCSARLPVYLLLIGAFVEPKFGAGWAGFALFAMHLLGLLVAIPIAWLLNRKLIRGKRLPFVLELPPYQLPNWRDVWLTMYSRGKVFVQTAGTIIVVMSAIIWVLSSFPRINKAQELQVRAASQGLDEGALTRRLDEYQLEQSILGRFGHAIEPVFLPAGFDWRITTSILAAFPARETVVPSLGILFSLGGEVDHENRDLKQAIQEATWPDGRPLFTAWTAVGLMVFFALCAQCMATLATVRREANSWGWAAFMFVYMTTLAYVAAVGIHQLGRLVGGVAG